MTAFLPPNLLALFAPRDPIPYLPPAEKLPYEKKVTHNYTGIAQYVHLFEDPVDTPAAVEVETREEKKERRKKEKTEQVAYKLEQEIALWDPNSGKDTTEDPFKTLFIARVNYYTSESKMRREFETYGTIKSIRIVQNVKDGKPRGYAFIEYESERDMHSAYKHADGKKIDGRRVLVDVERGRTVKGWLPRRLGGGLGGTRKGGSDVNVRHSGRDDGRRERGDASRRRSKSRSRDRKVKRSRSRDRKKRSRSRDRKRSRSRDKKRSKRSRSRSRERRRRERENGGGDEVNVKEEPEDTGYDQQIGNVNFSEVNVKQEKEDTEKVSQG
ncbi:U1 small nuclear ribonucleoprotein 70 kDa [Eurytemora carolleeae]|uniref:U1 small nuclear ribonucleoprotein 70 kDa n=1 Tax=Eurytemora carolleeae TaxID=1294199 RepID=UPI000C775642|nr:U1 small nuclear ribonucleoprotein 70 kDa [Eurytemora carolleeae]|eukprot:XP_023342083.1 U1 small nuclear ribonucleoprotein 70 kDa-like [Eurytemora affinis]